MWKLLCPTGSLKTICVGWIVCAALSVSAPLQAEEKGRTVVYVSKSPEQQIRVFELDPREKKLNAVQTISVDG